MNLHDHIKECITKYLFGQHASPRRQLHYLQTTSKPDHEFMIEEYVHSIPSTSYT